jgi:hypothetical protein
METTIAVPNSPLLTAAPSKGRAIGALICGAFGTVWMLEALYFGAIKAPVWLAAIAILAVICVWSPLARLYSLRRAPYASASGQSWSAISKAYWTIVVVEWVACAVAMNWLNYIHRPDLGPEFIGGIVGLHFFPLAKIFKAPIYCWTGAAMTLGVLASLAIPVGPARGLVACGICGLSLWATEAVILWQYEH